VLAEATDYLVKHVFHRNKLFQPLKKTDLSEDMMSWMVDVEVWKLFLVRSVVPRKNSGAD
jgi:hypothetical protein